MNFEEMISRLQGQLGDALVVATTSLAGDPFVTIPVGELVKVLSYLKEDADLDFHCLTNLTGVDAPPDDLEVVYHLISYNKKHVFTLKVRVPKLSPKVPTVENIYPTANWQEREAYDLLGVIFEGHSDLRRIMLPADWIGHPLRKDYKEQDYYRGIATTRPSLLD